ncbi:MAG TPA: hypothetical protein VMU45_14700 [Candidatus Eisenbacteria bacterium]|nr:hypothetical protein [Candidatus Eisenbacteria bacterium]
MSYPTCNHRKPHGLLCGSPAVRSKKLCFYHHRDHQRRQYAERILRCNDPLRPSASLPRTLADMQVMLSEVLTALTDDSISNRRVGKLLYALQQRSASLRD